MGGATFEVRGTSKAQYHVGGAAFEVRPASKPTR